MVAYIGCMFHKIFAKHFMVGNQIKKISRTKLFRKKAAKISTVYLIVFFAVILMEMFSPSA